MLMKTTRKTTAEIVAAVGKTEEHETIEKQVVEMKAKRDEINTSLRAIYREGSPDKHAVRINELTAEIAKIEAAMRPLRGRLLELREAHGERVARALVPLCSEIASTMIAMIDELAPEARAFEETIIAIETAGLVDTRRRVAMPWWGELRDQLSRMVVRT